MPTVTMTYGSYSFRPVPFLRITKDYAKTSDGTRIGTLYRTTLNGTIVNTNPGGLSSVMSGQDVLKSGLAQDGRLFLVQCDGGTVLSAYPRINSINFDTSDNNWVNTCPYSVEMEFDDQIAPPSSLSDVTWQPPYLQSASEEWNVEFVDDKSYYSWSLDTGLDRPPFQLRMTHNVSAVGKMHYGPSGLVKSAWEQARDYVVPKLGFDSSILASSGSLNINSGLYSAFNHTRTQNINETDGSFAVTESWLVINTGTGIAAIANHRAVEDFTVTSRQSIEKGEYTVTIEGMVQGLEQRSWGSSPDAGFSITRSKDINAQAYFRDIENKLYYRALYAIGYGANFGVYTLNTDPVNQSVAVNPIAGTISYNYEYNTRPSNCIAGALTENISVNDNNPTDLFATLTVLGRTNGPILQSLGTVTAATREVSIECVMAPFTGCPTTSGTASGLLAASPRTAVATLLCAFQADLQGRNGYVFKNADTERWEPKSGRYSRQVTWTYQQCSGTAPTLC